jgi:hypothetical protein
MRRIRPVNRAVCKETVSGPRGMRVRGITPVCAWSRRTGFLGAEREDCSANCGGSPVRPPVGNGLSLPLPLWHLMSHGIVMPTGFVRSRQTGNFHLAACGRCRRQPAVYPLSTRRLPAVQPPRVRIRNRFSASRPSAGVFTSIWAVARARYLYTRSRYGDFRFICAQGVCRPDWSD